MFDIRSPQVSASAAALRSLAGGAEPRAAMLLGTGWAQLLAACPPGASLAYGALPAFPATSVAGHEGRIGLLGTDAGPVWLLAGRSHAYEHGRCDAMQGAVATLASLGVRTLVLTNAAGCLEPAWRVGSVMLVSDHLNMVQASPLTGVASERRFVDLRDAYDPALRASVRAAAAAAGIQLHEGVYAWMHGPQFETPAEIRMLRMLGAQAVGMSLVPETILARHAGLRVLGLSLLTNLGCGMDARPLSHAGTLAQADAAQAGLQRLAAALWPALAA